MHLVGIGLIILCDAKPSFLIQLHPILKERKGREGLIIIGQVVCATQYVVEEHLLKPPNTAAPLVLVGLEGVWGSLVMICAILPLFQFLPGNDVDNRYEHLGHSGEGRELASVVLVYDRRILCRAYLQYRRYHDNSREFMYPPHLSRCHANYFDLGRQHSRLLRIRSSLWRSLDCVWMAAIMRLCPPCIRSNDI